MDAITMRFDGACQALAARVGCGGAMVRRSVRARLAGADMPEYVMVVAGICVVAMGAFFALGGKVDGLLNTVSTKIASATSLT